MAVLVRGHLHARMGPLPVHERLINVEESVPQCQLWGPSCDVASAINLRPAALALHTVFSRWSACLHGDGWAFPPPRQHVQEHIVLGSCRCGLTNCNASAGSEDVACGGVGKNGSLPKPGFLPSLGFAERAP